MSADELMTFLASGITEVTGRAAPALAADTTVESIGLDSLQTLELVAWAEERLDVRVPDEELTTVRSIGELVGALSARLEGRL